jgi:glycerol kinase
MGAVRSKAGLIAAIDQGTTSTRCLVFDERGKVLGLAQHEHRQLYPRPGWVEHDAAEILRNARRALREALEQAKLGAGDIAALGITNQRETVVFWDKSTGEPLCGAIVWQDTRTKALCAELAREGGVDRFRAGTGLPLSTYFSGPKITWALREVAGLREAAERGQALCGTIDSWLVWSLTGGPQGGSHVTDVSNASRTQLMELRRLDWDDEILRALSIPRSMLPRIVPSSDPQGWGSVSVEGSSGGSISVRGAVGDQQAALLGQCCTRPGDAKNTYGTGCFLLANTGEEPVASKAGLLTTVAWQLGASPAVYALEGSVAVAGALVRWLRDNLGLIATSDEVEALARSVPDSAGVYLVPAFSGLFAPHWRPDARGVLVGLTAFANKAHVARAALDAVCLQVCDVVEAMRADAGIELSELRVDGGMVVNELLMQTQADLLGARVVRPAVAETTSLGAAFAAGLAAGVYPDLEELRSAWRAERTWNPAIDAGEREARRAEWRKAIERSLGWVE